MTRKENPVNKEARDFIANGYLRECLEKSGRSISNDAISKIVTWASFGGKC